MGSLRREVVLSVWVAPLRGQLPAVGWRMETMNFYLEAKNRQVIYLILFSFLSVSVSLSFSFLLALSFFKFIFYFF